MSAPRLDQGQPGHDPVSIVASKPVFAPPDDHTPNPWRFALFLVFGTLWGFFIHANVRWRFGVLEHVIATPFFHRWHHTNDALRDHNYAATFPFFDHLFGTYQSPDHWPTGYGIDSPMPPSLGGQLLEPFMPQRQARPPAKAAAQPPDVADVAKASGSAGECEDAKAVH